MRFTCARQGFQIPLSAKQERAELTVERFLIPVATGSKATPQWIASIRIAPPAAPHTFCNNDAHLRSFKDGFYKSREGGRLLALSRTRDPEATPTVILQTIVSVDPIVARI